ncbi:hypothetical protein DRN73_09685 [Candidatus Pacearchaeota archaeon]|nr:MAG: hypothetical protein DRN73_09685 [Candidatus Pacearchaeota archaeon]
MEKKSSHDIPKYLGGTDKDGRHWLCYECHKKYEWKIFSSCASYIKNLSPEIKRKLKKIALIVKEEFFK